MVSEMGIICISGKINFLTPAGHDTQVHISISCSKSFPVNLTFFNKELVPVACQILLTLLHKESIIEKPINYNWVIVQRIEFISNFPPFSIFWNNHIVDIFVDISKSNNFQSTDMIHSVLFLHYQLIDAELETISDDETVMALSELQNQV